MWAIHGHIVIFPKISLKVAKKFNKLAFVWYAGSIMGHQTLSITSLSHSKSFQKLLPKDLEISRTTTCSLVA